MTTTIIKKASWVIKWDEQSKAHHYLRDADVVFQDNLITFVGKDYSGYSDEVISGKDVCIMPGLINIHSHPSTEGMNKGFDADGIGGLLGEYRWMNALSAYSPELQDRATCAEFVMSELLLSGVTTLVDLSNPYPGWFELAERSGLRLYFAPMYTSTMGFWDMSSPYQVNYQWLEDEGATRMEEALIIIDKAINHVSGRLSGVMMPAQVDTCTSGLLQRSLQAAKERSIPLQIHAGQLINEFQEIIRLHGFTPIKYLDSIGLLTPQTTIAHAIMLDHYRCTDFTGTSDDIVILGKNGSSIAHCPLVYARTGDALDNFGRYKKEGINIGIGTDTYPHNMLEEMRTAILMARVISGKADIVSTADIFYAATIGGANALQRQDIGRISPGAKADLVLIDLSVPSMLPMRDPIRSLIHQAAERAIRDVIIDGVKVVENGCVITMGYADLGNKINDLHQKIESSFPQSDYAGRIAEEVSPLSLPVE
jgi:5-methylthioadenosine/S-adenosylhomocysteine deaminase